jgi:hypothetical protein
LRPHFINKYIIAFTAAAFTLRSRTSLNLLWKGKASRPHLFRRSPGPVCRLRDQRQAIKQTADRIERQAALDEAAMAIAKAKGENDPNAA